MLYTIQQITTPGYKAEENLVRGDLLAEPFMCITFHFSYVTQCVTYVLNNILILMDSSDSLARASNTVARSQGDSSAIWHQFLTFSFSMGLTSVSDPQAKRCLHRVSNNKLLYYSNNKLL